MRDLNDAEAVFEKLAEELEKLAASCAAHAESPDAPEEVRTDLGDMPSRTEMDNLTPLASTPEDAKTEADERVLTRLNRLNLLIEDKIGDILNG